MSSAIERLDESRVFFILAVKYRLKTLQKLDLFIRWQLLYFRFNFLCQW